MNLVATLRSGGAIAPQPAPRAAQSGQYYARISGGQLNDAVVLDYGCGYGRIARLMYYFSTTAQVIGVDPWDRSIAECEAARLRPNFRLSDYLPETLPVDGRVFDLAYAFSVFAHLSKRATFLALGTIRRQLQPEGMLCITIRPIEYWDQDSVRFLSPEARERLKAQHRNDGFAFTPHDRAPIDGEITYGETSMSFRWLDENFAGWKRVAIDRSLEDPLQLYVFLQAV